MRSGAAFRGRPHGPGRGAGRARRCGQRPALTSQGDGVEVKTPRWSVLVTVTGPEVPGEGLPYQAPATTCTWIVTMSGATGPVPVSASDFSSIDDEGNV